MKKLTLFAFFSVTLSVAFSQKVYFVYLQSENEQPFYVKMESRIHSSSASGYLILPRLKDSTYSFSIGIPGGKLSELNFSVLVNKKDHGYLLKNFGEKGWGLFDLQTLAVLMPDAANPAEIEKAVKKTDDVSPFTEILSKASDDPSLKGKTVQAKQEEKRPDTITQKAEIKEEIKTEAIVPVEIKKEEPVVESKDSESDNIAKIPELVYKQSVVTKKSESSTTEGFGLVFIDNVGNDSNDTIRLLIPNPKPIVDTFSIPQPQEKKFLDIITDTVKNVNTSIIQPVSAEGKFEKKAINKNCPEEAREDDFFNLRKNMANVMGDDEMISEAKKYFKVKCFSTEQIRNLSLLFLNDGGKYKFFDLAYEYVVDAVNFGLLQKELKEEYYLNRFKAMLRN